MQLFFVGSDLVKRKSFQVSVFQYKPYIYREPLGILDILHKDSHQGKVASETTLLVGCGHMTHPGVLLVGSGDIARLRILQNERLVSF